MTPLDLLQRLYTCGTRAELNGEGGIRLRGSPPPPELMDAVKANRDALVALLTSQGIGTCADGYASPIPRRYVTPPGCLTPRLCARIGPCSRFLMTRPCDDVNGSTP